MNTTDGPWELVNTWEEYRDYEISLPDNAQGMGGTMRITLVDEPGEEPWAYGTILWNSEECCELGEPSEFEISRELAEKIIGITSKTHQEAKAEGNG